MDNILVLDVSEAMSGEPLRGLIRAVSSFIDLIERIGLGDRISLITYGESVKTVHNFTSNYALLKRSLNGISATGGVPMDAALAAAVIQLGLSQVASIAQASIVPRVILVTAAPPDDKDKVFTVVSAFSRSCIPLVCLGLPGCDRTTMTSVAARTEGMFLMADSLDQLELYFQRQVHLITYVQNMQREFSKLEDRERIRIFLRDQSKAPVTDEELDGFVRLLISLVKIDLAPDPPEPSRGSASSRSSRSSVDSRLLSRIDTPASLDSLVDETSSHDYEDYGGSWRGSTYCRKTVKLLLTSYIVLFFIIGGALISTGSYYTFDHSSFLFRLAASIIAIGTGSFLIIQAFLAAVGGHRGSKCLFYTSSSVGILVLACTCGSLAMLLLYYTRDDIPVMITDIWDQDFNNVSIISWQDYFNCCGIQPGDTRYCNNSLPVQLPTCENQTITFVREQVLYAELLLAILSALVCFSSLFSLVFTCYYGKNGRDDRVPSLRLLSE